MSKRTTNLAIVLLVLVGWRVASAEEIWLYDNSRVYGLIKDVAGDKAINVQLPTGELQKVPLEEIIAVRFLGRNPLLVQSGTQEFRFINGGTIRGQIQGNTGDMVQLDTATAGPIDVNLAHVRGFVALPLAGFSGRKAEELVDSDLGKLSKALDVVLDGEGSTYPGVVRKLELTHLYLDHEDLLKLVPIKIQYIAGVRLANATRDPDQPWRGDVQVRLRSRDESIVQGHVRRVYLGHWYLEPLWEKNKQLKVQLEEISQVQILGGRVQYLSQLTPVRVKEDTIISPPQPYRMDRSCQGDQISIAGKRYPWGIGVHANSELTFELNGKFKEFRSEIGVATRMGDRGSVIFSVIGDGKELYKSPVIRGVKQGANGKANGKPVEVVVPVAGVKELTLKVVDAGDLDLGDVANWGSARVVR